MPPETKQKTRGGDEPERSPSWFHRVLEDYKQAIIASVIVSLIALAIKHWMPALPGNPQANQVADVKKIVIEELPQRIVEVLDKQKKEEENRKQRKIEFIGDVEVAVGIALAKREKKERDVKTRKGLSYVSKVLSTVESFNHCVRNKNRTIDGLIDDHGMFHQKGNCDDVGLKQASPIQLLSLAGDYLDEPERFECRNLAAVIDVVGNRLVTSKHKGIAVEDVGPRQQWEIDANGIRGMLAAKQ